MVSRVRQKWPMHSIVIANTAYSFNGAMVHKVGAKYKAAVGKDVTYDVLMFDHATFQLKGDGGFQNVSIFDQVDYTNTNFLTVGLHLEQRMSTQWWLVVLQMIYHRIVDRVSYFSLALFGVCAF